MEKFQQHDDHPGDLINARKFMPYDGNQVRRQNFVVVVSGDAKIERHYSMNLSALYFSLSLTRCFYLSLLRRTWLLHPSLQLRSIFNDMTMVVVNRLTT